MDHRRFIQEHFPSLEVRTFVPIEEGWDSHVFEVNGEWIFRIPRNTQVARHLAKEIALLPALAEALPAAIPNPQWVTLEPTVCMGYRKIHGKPLRGDQLSSWALDVAEHLGRFLAAVHRFPVDLARRLSAPFRDAGGWRQDYVELCGQMRRRVFPVLMRRSDGPRPTCSTSFWAPAPTSGSSPP